MNDRIVDRYTIIGAARGATAGLADEMRKDDEEVVVKREDRRGSFVNSNGSRSFAVLPAALRARRATPSPFATAMRLRGSADHCGAITVLEGIEEHNVVDTLLGELTDLAPDNEAWGAKATVMREGVEHHIEEEETEIFAKARRIVDPSELEALGRRMAARKVTARASVRMIADRREQMTTRARDGADRHRSDRLERWGTCPAAQLVPSSRTRRSARIEVQNRPRNEFTCLQ